MKKEQLLLSPIFYFHFNIKNFLPKKEESMRAFCGSDQPKKKIEATTSLV